MIFEYTMIKGVNMNHFDAKRLSEILRGFPCHVNLIMLNPVKEKNLTGCTKEEGERFMKKLNEMGVKRDDSQVQRLGRRRSVRTTEAELRKWKA